ncbi:enolase C-terminal domain-like protein [Bacillus licheniformis]|nr:enolase C-terminal domain-like protein [Bacillus licheniformis]
MQTRVMIRPPRASGKRGFRLANVLWFEEPMPFDDLAEYRMLRSALSVPVAGGENVKAQSRFADFLENAVDIAQPDVMHCEGTDEFQTVLKLARHFGKGSLPTAMTADFQEYTPLSDKPVYRIGPNGRRRYRTA